NRSWRAYWWSPDSKRIAFFQIDSSRVPRWTIPADHLQPRSVEDAPYPRPGEPNPGARFGIVTVAGGPVRWADLSDYADGQFLITGAGWMSSKTKPGDPVPESRAAFCYIQNRQQTWMDLLSVPTAGGKPKRLMRDTTKAWVEPLGDPVVLKDGSFILPSERDGY